MQYLPKFDYTPRTEHRVYFGWMLCQPHPVIVWCWGSWTLVAGMWVKLASLWVGILQEEGG